jgi:hypothetical protein
VDDIKKCLSTDWTYQYYETKPSDLPVGMIPSATHEVRFKFGRADVIVEDTFAYVDSASPTLAALIEKYGKAEKITWSRASPHLRAVLFCHKGVIAHLGGGNEDQTHWIFYFEPMSLDQCTEKFASEIPAHNPFANGDVFGDENPWPWFVSTK